MTKKKTVDARGQLCTKPLILTKKALRGLASGEQIAVLIDNETSKEVDYFDVKADVQVGTVSNMYTILEELSSASSVVYP